MTEFENKFPRIGICGGTFNPIHLGHLMIAQTVREEFHLDKIYFIPTGIPPHKDLSAIADARHRLHMIKLAIAGTLFLLTILQFLSIPGQFRYMAEQEPERAFLRWPLTILGMLAILAIQIVLVSLWFLID